MSLLYRYSIDIQFSKKFDFTGVYSESLYPFHLPRLATIPELRLLDCINAYPGEAVESYGCEA